MNINEEMNYVQKATESMRAKMRLLWTLLRIMSEHGWKEDTDPSDFLADVLEKLERQPENKDYFEREVEAQQTLEEVKLLVAEVANKLNGINKYGIMKYGPQFDLNDAQELLAKVNNHIKRIYDLRSGLTK